MNQQRADHQRLQEFVRHGDQAAFAALVQDHLSLVYATALRRVTDPSTAEEICQNVFLALARKAWRLARHQSLPAWLHRTTVLESSAWRRQDFRRRRREQIAAQLATTVNESNESSTSRELTALLDEAINSLREKDRAALLLRYFESKPFAEVGIALGLSESAAQKRVSEAVIKLQRFFQHNGFKAISVGAILAGIEQTTASASPALAASITQAAAPAGMGSLFALKALAARALTLTKGKAAAVLLTPVLAFSIWDRVANSAVPPGPSFSVAGKIVQSSGSETNTFPFEMDVVGRTWYLRLLAPADVGHLLYDGTNQYVVSFPREGAARKPLTALVHNSSIPHGGSHFQTLWFAFCGPVWSPMEDSPFVNLQSFAQPPVRTNVNLRVHPGRDGRILSTSLTYSNRSEEFPIESFVFSKWTNIGTTRVPLTFSRQIHSRLGVEHVKGTVTQPPLFKTPRE